ncbi:polysaccharide pyruvyl transferase family protein [Motiliproteus sp. MSK22-1]|uniref:polysaccharide pyruvyl transferase family protein n=1 Tax=Motiliproteus sp. MSK22-1 TaxID=1897630 RepID=UPI000977471C|nr:polysaccharide pyruvyl transferase family protein [Motiliproteus sp. MSK22-1]OMH26632.1 hypothetical protein BGP75_23330 [Motiliproteus sp. MSK22-1]
MKDIILYGAFDRHNYGDLLFPLVMQRLIKNRHQNSRIFIAGMIESDLSRYGALKTDSIKNSLRKSSDSAVIILAGGHIIGCTWIPAIRYLIPHIFESFFRRIVCRYFSKQLLYFSKKYIGINSDFPFQPIDQDLSDHRSVIFNSVGAISTSEISNDYINDFKESLNKASYISVRDTRSKEGISDCCKSDIFLSPDSATMIVDLFSEEEINRNTNKETLSLINELKNSYIVFQISKVNSNLYGDDFSKSISELYHTTKLPIVFIAIGNAAGHRDIDGIHKIIKNLTPDVKYHIYEDGGVFEIMNLIKNSSCYCGTSLHGIVTSMSFSIPRVGLLPKIQKQVNYMDTWDLPEMPRAVLPENLTESVIKSMNIDKKLMKDLSRSLISKYMDNFDKMSPFMVDQDK